MSSRSARPLLRSRGVEIGALTASGAAVSGDAADDGYWQADVPASNGMTMKKTLKCKFIMLLSSFWLDSMIAITKAILDFIFFPGVD